MSTLVLVEAVTSLGPLRAGVIDECEQRSSARTWKCDDPDGNRIDLLVCCPCRGSVHDRSGISLHCTGVLDLSDYVDIEQCSLPHGLSQARCPSDSETGEERVIRL